MIHRIVRMTLHPDHVADFMALFSEIHASIEAQPGCLGVRLWSDVRFPNIVTTFSRWETAADLETYRTSDFFRSTWSRTKPLFAAPPEAASYTDITPPAA